MALLPNYLERSLSTEWAEIRATWDDCAHFFTQAGLSKNEVQALCMATHELLENAVKYGDVSAGSSIQLRLRTTAATVTVEVKNRATGDLRRLKDLDESIQWIRGFQNPFEAYVEKLKLLAAQPYEPSASGLGLVRIAYEAQCMLDCFLDERGDLSMSAVYRAPHGTFHSR